MSPSRSTRFGMLASIDAVRQFRYRPGTVSNQPVPVDMNLTVNT